MRANDFRDAGDSITRAGKTCLSSPYEGQMFSETCTTSLLAAGRT